jgi:hypothetical protein
MNTEELELKQTIRRLTDEASGLQKDDPALRRLRWAMVQAWGKLAQLAAHNYDFDTADKEVKTLAQLVQDLAGSAEPKEKLTLHGILWNTEAIVSDEKGMYYLFERGDYVHGPDHFGRAVKMYEQTADALSNLGGEEHIVQSTRGQALRAQGLQQFGLGRYDIQVADTYKAEKELKEATDYLKQASAGLAKDPDTPESSAFNWHYVESLAAYAHGFWFRARADSSAYDGNYKQSSELLGEQIKAFDEAQQPIYGLTDDVAKSMTSRIAQEKNLCEQRQKNISSRTGRMSAPTLLFAVLAVVTFFLQLWLATYFGWKPTIILYIFALVFAVIVGGVGTGLATWGDATGFFEKIISLWMQKKST